MRRVILGGTGIETSALGFGCASLGSRVGAEAGAAGARRGACRRRHLVRPRPGLRRRRGRGDRRAVPAAHRDEVQIATKAGLALAAGAGGGLRRRLMPLARGALALAGPAAAGAAAPGGADGQRQAAADARR